MRGICFFCFVFLTFPVFAGQETLTNGKEEERLVPVEVERTRDAVVKILIFGYVEENNRDVFRKNNQESPNSVNLSALDSGHGNGFCNNERKDCGH